MSPEHKKYIRKLKRQSLLVKVIQIFILITFFATWELASRFNIINSFIFSSPSSVIKTLINLVNENNLFIHIFTTLKEVIIAFSLGILIGFIIALLLYSFEMLAKIVDPFLTLLNSLPKVALGPILVIWIGANSSSIIAMALLINLIISIVTIYNGFLAIDPTRIKLLKTFKASKSQIITDLVIPSSYKTLISSLKLNISMSLIGVIMGEFLVSKQGIGYLIIYGTQVFNLHLVMAGIVILLIISYILYKIVTKIEDKLIK